MITEDYVSFEIAKLLKEKGFESECHSYYYPCHYPDGSIKYEKDMGAQRGTKTWYNVYSLKTLPKDHYLAPTLQMAMKWLREVHHIYITTYYRAVLRVWQITINWFDKMGGGARTLGKYDNYEEACEAAIKYCLEKII